MEGTELSSIKARMSPLKVTGIRAIVGMGDVESSSIIVELLPLRAAGIRASEGMGGVESSSIVTEPSPSGAACICAREGMGVVCGMVDGFLAFVRFKVQSGNGRSGNCHELTGSVDQTCLKWFL